MRALLAFAAVFPTVLCSADPVAAAPSCAHPASFEDHRVQGYAPYKMFIFFKPDSETYAYTELAHKYTLTILTSGEFPARHLKGLVVAPPTASEIAELRCESYIELIELESGT